MVCRCGRFLRRTAIVASNGSDAIRQDTLLLVGVMDVLHMSHNDKGSTVTMEGRDLRGLLLDRAWVPTVRLDLTKPIDDVVRQIISHHSMGSRFTVGVQADDWDGNVSA